MQKNPLLNNVKPYLTIFSALIILIIIIADTYFTNELPSHWLPVLWFFLLFAILIVVIQLAHAEKNTRNLGNQLSITKERLGNEIKHRLWAEKTASENKIKSQFIDENFPVMLAYFNTELRCRYHNRIFRRWFGLNPDQIDGHFLTEFSNEEFFSDIQNNIEKNLNWENNTQRKSSQVYQGFSLYFHRTISSSH